MRADALWKVALLGPHLKHTTWETPKECPYTGTLWGCDPAQITGVRWDSLPDCCAAMDPQRLFRKQAGK